VLKYRSTYTFNMPASIGVDVGKEVFNIIGALDE
jgi:hypothetical protein